MRAAMRHHWLLLGACGWALLILVFVSKFITFRAIDDYGERTGWTEPATKGVRPDVVSGADRRAPRRMQMVIGSMSVSQPSAPPTAEGWQAVTEKRLELVSNVCRNGSLGNLTRVPISKFVLDRIFVCDKHEILFCQTPKVGNTQWKKVLIVLNGAFPSVEEIPESLVHNHEKNGLPRLSSLAPQEITRRLNTYFKFLIVRDPFERLISAFKDKFVNNPRFEPWYKHDIAPPIIRKYRRSHRDGDLAAAGLHFEDFVRYLGDAEGRRRLDRQFGHHIIHWVTF
ncbi:carbohydrate sulfotransferase 10, partial [Brachionichthys hirsutus]|uniref:carbohydrate sulfotransferase 10 n=1 Tax=Brachionichthys hirsutus TaxID=412623 RepID=UPI0036053696